MNCAILSSAQLEAADAAVWYDDQRQGLGNEFLEELERALDRIQNAPESFASLELYSGSHEVRRCLLNRFPYLVIYLCRTEEVLILAISHVRRQPLYWLERLG